jgi:D-alanyl-D-alanine carboxypeptidase
MSKKVLMIIVLTTAVIAAAVGILLLTGMFPGLPDKPDGSPGDAFEDGTVAEDGINTEDGTAVESGSVTEDGTANEDGIVIDEDDVKADFLRGEMPFGPEEGLSGTDPDPSAGDIPFAGDRSGDEYREEPIPAEKLSKNDLSAWNLILVNSENPVPRDFTVDLTRTDGGYLVDVRIADALETMIADAAAKGITLRICSAFRTVRTQKALVDRKAQSLMASGFDADLAYSAANRYIAQPGESEHHTGLAVDFLTDGIQTLDESFTETKAYTWLTENAHRYGFILRYPQGKEEITHFAFEPWHYRYVGREHAAAIKKSGLCLEEYLDTAG